MRPLPDWLHCATRGHNHRAGCGLLDVASVAHGLPHLDAHLLVNGQRRAGYTTLHAAPKARVFFGKTTASQSFSRDSQQRFRVFRLPAHAWTEVLHHFAPRRAHISRRRLLQRFIVARGYAQQQTRARVFSA